MTTDSYGQWIGTPMDDAVTEELLESKGYGVLSLASGDVPYSIPVSFGYDGEAVYFVLLETGGGGRKFEFIEAGGPARLLVTDIGGRFDWRSVAVEGPVERVDPDTEAWEPLIAALDANGWFTRAFERDPSLSGMVGWRLAVEDVRGLQVLEE